MGRENQALRSAQRETADTARKQLQAHELHQVGGP
jgi:hypothetical protein